MIILTIRTDKPESEIGLYDNEEQLGYETWEAHRQLAETIHQKVQQLLQAHGRQLEDVEGIVGYKGSGSFTGLRIGLSVANAFAYGLQIPIFGVEGEEQWIQRGVDGLLAGKNDQVIIPAYGAPVHITRPKH